MSKDRKPAEVFHPGEFLRDELAARGWSIGTLAAVTGMFPERWESLIAKKRALTTLDASMLAMAFETSAELWINLQKSFDDWNQK